MLVHRNFVVGWIEVEPAYVRIVHGEPGMGRVGALQLLLSGGRLRFEIARDVTRGQALGTQAGNCQVREILAHATPVLEDVLQRRRDLGESRVVGEIHVYALHQVMHRFGQWPPAREGDRGVLADLRAGIHHG